MWLNYISSDPTAQIAFVICLSVVVIVWMLKNSENTRVMRELRDDADRSRKIAEERYTEIMRLNALLKSKKDN